MDYRKKVRKLTKNTWNPWIWKQIYLFAKRIAPVQKKRMNRIDKST